MKLDKRYLSVLVFIVLAVAVVIAGCGGTTTTTGASTSATAASSDTTAGPTSTTGPAVTLKIGAAGPFTGDLSKIGADGLHSVQFAVEDFNKSGAMPGVTFVVEAGDDAGDPAQAATVAQKFVEDKAVVGVIGPMNSSTALAALPILNDANLCMITQSASADPLAEKGYSVFHRVCPADGVQAPSLAKFAVEDLGIKKAFVIDDKATNTKGLADQLVPLLTEKGVEVQQEEIAMTDKDFSSVLTKVKAFSPDALFCLFQSPAQGGAIAKQAKSMGIEVQMICSDGCNDPHDFIEAAGGATEGAYVTSLGPLATALPTAKEFLDRYIAKYGAISAFTATSYEATMVLLNAVKSVGVSGGTVDRKAVNDAVGKITYEGILGFPISFDSKGNLASGGIYIIQVQGDHFEQIKGITL